MRNLWPFLVCSSEELPALSSSCVDPFTHTVYYVTTEHDLMSTQGLMVPLEPAPFRTPLLSLVYLQDREMCCLIFAAGDVCLASEQSAEVSSLAALQGENLLAAAWSPSQEVLCLATASGRVLFLNSQFDQIAHTAEVAASVVLEAALAWKTDSKFVEVAIRREEGWFAYSCSVDGQIHISAAKSDPPGGLVQCVGERPALFDGPSIDWQHDGLLTGVKGGQVVFWEKNGLRHGQFEATATGSVQRVVWNSEGDILLLEVHEEHSTELQLWYRSNYHWYLKQTIPCEEKIQGVHWADAYNLLVLTTRLWTYEWKWSYDVSPQGLAVVVDGRKVCLTRFDRECVPPPMCSFQVELPGVPTAMAFTQEGLPVLIVSQRLYTIEEENLSTKATLPQLSSAVANFSYGSSELAISLDTSLLTYTHEMNPGPVYTHDSSIIAVVPSPSGGFFIEDKSGVILLARDGQVSQVAKLPRPCISLTAVEMRGQAEFVGLHRSTKSLYLGQNLLTNACLSFVVAGSYLCYTTVANAPLHVMYMFSLAEPLPLKLMGPTTSATPPSVDSFSVRNVERGSRIVTVVGTKLVQQLPRGNIETIHPRLLLIDRAKVLISQHQFLSAFELLKTHKLDLNFLCDYDYHEFISSQEDFVQQLDSADRLNLFLTALSPLDSSAQYCSRPAQPAPQKVNQICAGLRTAIEKANPNKLLLSLVTTFVRSDPPQLIEVLRLIQDLRTRVPPKPHKPPHITQQRDRNVYAEDALKYVCWLVDGNKLYDVALQTYDLELVLMVAQHTEKDPKEYLPYLQCLSELPDTDRRVTICKDLGQFETALAEMKTGGSAYYSAALKLVKEKSLYGKALQLFSATEIEHTLETLYGDFLLGQRQFFQAGVMYRRAGELTKAMNCFEVRFMQHAQEWDLMFAAAATLGLHTPSIAAEQVSLATERGDYRAAVYLLRNYCDKNEDTARDLVRSLIYQHRYTEAVATATGLPELEQIVRNAVVLKSEQLAKDLIKNLEIVTGKKQRLDLVKAKKAAMPIASLSADEETASQYSVDSKASAATAVTKGKAKALKKLRKSAAKEGSQFEEDYVVDLLLTLRPDSALLEQIEAVYKGLLLVNETAPAVRLSEALARLSEATSTEFRTIRHSAFLNEFYARFPDVKRVESVEARLCDIVTESFFLDSGQASHLKPTAKVRRDLESFVASFRGDVNS